MANQKMQAVRVTLSDGREALFVGRVLFEDDADAREMISDLAISEAMEWDDRITIADFLLFSSSGSKVQ